MYAKLIDWLMMLLGFISAVIVGCALPITMLVFGSVVNTFINLAVRNWRGKDHMIFQASSAKEQKIHSLALDSIE